RDFHVTGVQTCALPILPEEQSTATPGDGPKVSKPTTENFSRNVIDPAYAFSDEDEPSLPRWKVDQRKPRERKSSKRSASQPSVRSEERRVGKECRARWA